MKSTVQPVKLSEPLKSVETSKKHLGHSKNSNANDTEGGHAFQSMLKQQVQDRKQLERNAQNKQAQEKDNQPVEAKKASTQQAKTTEPEKTFVKRDIVAKPAPNDQTISKIQGKANTKAGASKQFASTQDAQAKNATATEAAADIKNAKSINADQNVSSSKKSTKAHNQDNAASPEVADASRKVGMVDTKVVSEQTSKVKSDDVKKSKTIKHSAIDATVKADSKSKATRLSNADNQINKSDLQAVGDEIATSKKTTKAVSSNATLKPDAKTSDVAVNAPLDHVATKKASRGKTKQSAEIDLTVKPDAKAKVATKAALVDKAVTSKVAQTQNSTATAVADALAVQAKSTKVTSNPLKATNDSSKHIDVTHQALADDAQVKQAEAFISAEAAKVVPQSAQVSGKAVDEVTLSPVDAMVKQATSDVVKKKTQEKVALAKDLQNAASDKAMVEADDALLASKETRVSMDNPRAVVRTTDFVQNLNQNVLNNQIKMRGDQPEAFKSFSSIQGMSDVNGASTQAMPSLQPATPSSTLQAAANLMSSPLAASNLINTPFSNKAGWNQAINQKVMYMVGNGDQTAKLTLNPPDLGPLQVVISVNNEKADTTFISANDDVRQALEDGLENLREKMGEAGVELGQANVNTGEQYAQQQQTAQTQTGGNSSQQAVEAETVVSSTPVARNSNGLVDTFA